MSKLWFKAKTYGYGVTPASWEGWAATAVFCVLIVSAHAAAHALFADPAQGDVAAWTAIAILVAGFFWLAVAKGERVWRWRWGRGD